MENILMLILALVTGGLLVIFFTQRAFKKTLEKSQFELIEAKSKLTGSENELSEAKRSISSLSTELTKIREKVVAVETSGLHLSETKATLAFEVSECEEKILNLQGQLSKAKEISAAFEENCKNLTDAKRSLEETIQQLKNENASTASDMVKLKEKVSSLEAINKSLNDSKSEAATEAMEKIKNLEEKVSDLQEEKESLTKDLVALNEKEPIRLQEYDKKITQLTNAYKNLDDDRARERSEKELAEEKRVQLLKDTWSRHETEVEEKMKLICQQLGIEYIGKEKFPFSGKPDNAVKICGEYIVFDGKSPQGTDLDNFPIYIRAQAEAAKKYIKSEEVKKDIYLVVPANAIQSVRDTYIPLGTHRVHVVTIDSLQPVLIHLKKIEEYEFADKLSPEDREKIVSIIGKMAHGMKRRIQIDHFFANEFISILMDGENLPPEILAEARKIEHSSKLNPTTQKRAKKIEIGELEKEGQKLIGRVQAQEIHLGPELHSIEEIPLHKKNDDN